MAGKREGSPKKSVFKRVLPFILVGAAAAGVGAGITIASGAGSAAVRSGGIGGSGTPGYQETTVVKGNIQKSRSFTGTIAPVTERSVIPDVTGIKITEVSAKKGDEVKQGDTIALLDSDSINEQIKELEATMSATEKNNALQIQSAREKYDNYKSNLDNGQDSQVLSAQQAIDSAFSALVSAQQAYNTEVKLNNQQLSQTILTAMNNVDSSYEQVKAAELSLNQAEDRKDAYGDSQNVGGYDPNQASVDSGQLSLESAWSNYNYAVKSYDAAKVSEESNLTNLFDQYINAQVSYLNALDNYNSTVTQSQQTLQSYSTSVQQAEASADDSVNELKLSNLYSQLDDCTVKSPISGVITELDATVGDMAGTTSLATVTSFDEMKVEIKINEYDIEGVDVGDKVNLTIDATGDQYEGTITYISREATVSNGVSYFSADVEFDGDDKARGGMSVEAKLIVTDLKDILLIPKDAVRTAADGSAYVLVPSTDAKGKETTAQQTIEIGATDGKNVEVTSGLSEGDTILYTPSSSQDALEFGMEGPSDEQGQPAPDEGGSEQ